MTKKDFDDIATLVAMAEGAKPFPNSFGFTCWIVESMRRNIVYSQLFSFDADSYARLGSWTLSEDVELNKDALYAASEEELAPVIAARLAWRQTALGFAAAMIATGDL